MRKKVRMTAFFLALLFVLNGCWNYRSLNDIALVAGMAVDMDPESKEYKLAFEIVDLNGDIASSGPKAKLIESRGKTIFDAVRNAKKRLEKRLFFGNAQVLVMSEEIAKDGHIMHLIDWFLRDAELRETAHVIVSQEKTAAEILNVKGVNNAVVAYEIENIVTDDKTATSSTSDLMLYQIYNTLHAEGLSLTLPAFHKVINDGEPACEVNGSAVFKEQILLGYLTPEESKYLLFVLDEVKGGILTLSAKGHEQDDVSLEISQNKTKQSFSVEDGKLKVTVDTETNVYLAEIASEFDALDEEKVTSLEAAAGAKLKQGIEDMIRKVQSEYRSDIFGFGNTIHKKNSKLWSSISGYWEDLFPTLEVTVHSKISIVNSAYSKSTMREGGK